jgi:hypothetical protein
MPCRAAIPALHRNCSIHKARGENALHWQLDVSFREDAARNRKDNAPGNIAVLHRRALDVVRCDQSKSSLSIKLKRAGWDEEFLRNTLSGVARD